MSYSFIKVSSSSHVAEFLCSHGASDVAMEWCSTQGITACSDLQFVAECYLPRCAVLLALWSHLQGRPTSCVADIVQVLKESSGSMAAPARSVSVAPWRPSKRAKASIPERLSEDQQRRRAASRVVVELSWQWASLGFGLGHGVPAFMTARRQEAMIRTLADGFEEKLLINVVRTWQAFLAWFNEQRVDMPEHGWPSVYIEDFLENVVHKSGGASALLTFYKLKWLSKRAKAPLNFEDVQRPVVATSGAKGVAQQRPALEPAMLWRLLASFKQQCAGKDAAAVQGAVAVIAAFTPIRYIHVNRSVPVWRNTAVAVFWAFRDKKRQSDGSRRGFAWHVILYLPEVRSAVHVLWKAWHSLAKREQFKEEIPSFLSCNFHTGHPVGTADFNKFLVASLGSLVANPKLLSSYCLRRIQPTALDIRDASWEDRHRVAAWSMPGARMEDCMPVRYSGARASGEVEVKAVQQYMFEAMRKQGSIATWQQARQWWVSLPPGTFHTWQAAASKFVSGHSKREIAARIEHLVSSAAQPSFELVEPVLSRIKPQPVAASSHSEGKASESESIPLPVEDEAVAWKAPAKRGAYAHACRGVTPLCKQKRRAITASFKRDLNIFRDIEHARQTRSICPRCTQLVASTE